MFHAGNSRWSVLPSKAMMARDKNTLFMRALAKRGGDWIGTSFSGPGFLGSQETGKRDVALKNAHVRKDCSRQADNASQKASPHSLQLATGCQPMPKNGHPKKTGEEEDSIMHGGNGSQQQASVFVAPRESNTLRALPR